MPRTRAPQRPFELQWAPHARGAAAGVADPALAAVAVRGAVTGATCARWVTQVKRARSAWTADFGGEQFTLGRAFYTHYETDRASDYFRDAEASDARVEAHVPGMRDELLALFAELTGAKVRPRRGWCGPGVHVFPAGGEVAERGGIVHFDTEGLAERHAADARPALTLVVMLQPAETGGELKLWDARWRGRDHPTRRELAKRSLLARYEAGMAIVIDSYRLHQIQPFGGTRDRISATLHAAEVDVGVWETWF